MFGFILSFVVVLALAKSVSSTFQFYKAALVYFLLVIVLGLVFGQHAGFAKVIILGFIKFLIALPYFYLLDRYEDTIFTWLLIFAAGFLVLAIV